MRTTVIRVFVAVGMSCTMLLTATSARAYCGGGATAAPSAPPSAVQPGSSSSEVETVTTSAPEDPAIIKARVHFVAGGKAFNAADYRNAAKEWKQAESMTTKFASPALDRLLGQVNEKLHRPRVAMKYYQRFLTQHFWGSDADEVNARIATLEPEAAKAAATPGEAADMPPSAQNEWIGYDPFDGSPPRTTVVVRRAAPKYWWVGLVAVSGAAVIVGVSVGFTNHGNEQLPIQNRPLGLTIHF